MKTYDVQCPICEALNQNLYLEETGGWMECEKCGRIIYTAFSVDLPQTSVLHARCTSEYLAAFH